LFIEGLKYVILENKIGRLQLKFMVDTGATSNVIKLSSVCKNVPIRPCQTVFKGISGKFRRSGMGKILEYEGK
jgi:Retroviral aspartyl protease